MADNLNTIKCPACQKEMVKIFIPEQGINIDVCLNGCGGIYFDNREFQYFDEAHENIDKILDAYKGKKFIDTDDSLPRSCPVCGAKMVKNYSSIKKQIQIDECYACGGKFLDREELQKIREEYPTNEERGADILKEVYATVGAEILEQKAKTEETKRKRSVLKKLFDHLVYD